jgi:hypothetical protein
LPPQLFFHDLGDFSQLTAEKRLSAPLVLPQKRNKETPILH